MLWNQSLSIEFAIPRNSVTTACAGMPRVARLPRFSARAGLDPKIIGYKRVERCIARWKAENAEKAAQEQEAQE